MPRDGRAQLFGPRIDLNTAAVPRSVEIADLNGDGHLDVVVAVQAGNEVSIGAALAGLDGVTRGRIRNFSLVQPFSLPVSSLLIEPTQTRALNIGPGVIQWGAGEARLGAGVVWMRQAGRALADDPGGDPALNGGDPGGTTKGRTVSGPPPPFHAVLGDVRA